MTEEEEFVSKFTNLSAIMNNGQPDGSLTNGSSGTRELPPVPRDIRPPLASNPPTIIPPRIKISRPPSEITKFIPEQEITIPSDGNISKFTVDEMTTCLKHMNTTDKIVNHLRKKKLDGKRFSKITDSELESLGLKNPIMLYFRDRSSKQKKTMPFML